MVVPRFVRQALRGEPITVYGDGTQSRCFCHVRDAVGALRALLALPDAYGQLFNVGNNEEVTIAALAEQVRTLAGSAAEARLVPYREAYGAGFEDMQRRVPDLSKVGRAIGYRPRYSLHDILRDVIEYERSADLNRSPRSTESPAASP
jgi:UDP-glucose 4-epimerase